MPPGVSVSVTVRARAVDGRPPLALKLAFTAFMAVLVPVYWYFYGPTNFLYFCDIALFLTLAGIWLESPLLISMCAVGIVAPQIIWCIDFISNMFGMPLLGMTDYMFKHENSLFLRGLSLFHGWIPFLLDAAYADFDPGRDPMHLVHEYDNVIVTRTFSKTWSMAGTRLGYLVGPRWLVAELDKVVLPYHLDSAKQIAGRLALRYVGEMNERVEQIVAERERIQRAFDTLPVDHFPSGANFVLFRPRTMSGRQVWQGLLDRSVVTPNQMRRHFAPYFAEPMLLHRTQPSKPAADRRARL